LVLTVGSGRVESRFDRFGDGPPCVASLIGREDFQSLRQVHRDLLVRLASQQDRMPVACCLEPTDEPDWQLVEALETAMGGAGMGFQWYSRWTTTASGPTGTIGDPITLRYSFVPDGTVITSGVGEPPTGSNLFATFNPLFGGVSVWQAHFAAVFQKWSQSCGVTFVLEPSDDGAPLSGATPGIIGVRGDIRIGGHFIDGQSGSNILAYNTYPSFGDMVLDTSNTAYFGSLANNALNLRNTVAHESGHGLGLAHVCPWNLTKLMEPIVTNVLDGPQHDDVQGAQWNYGDRFENNDSQATATDLGTLAGGTTTLTDVSCNSAFDADWYRFDVPASSGVTATLTPIGSTYLQGPEGGSCSTGTSTNSLAANDLGLSIHDQAGTALATANAGGAGVADTVPPFALPAGSTFWVRVFPGTTNKVQMYKLDLTILPIASGASVGSGCGSGPTIPVLSTTNPVLGLTTSITVTNAKPSHAGALVASYGTAAPSPLGMGCTAYVDLATFFVLAQFGTNAAGFWTMTMPLPSNPALGGLDVALQAVVYSPTSPLGIDVSNGLNAQIGY
jgi:Matrixin